MERVKKLIKAGASIPMAIKESLGLSVTEFATNHDLPRAGVSSALNGAARPTDAMIEALIADLGGTAEEWRELLRMAGSSEKAAV